MKPLPKPLVFLTGIALCACGGSTARDEVDAAWQDTASDVGPPSDASVGPPDRGIIIVDPRDPIVPRDPRESGATVEPDGRVTWPRSDSAVETPDADNWDAGASCPQNVPTDGDACTPMEGCSYPIDCCGIVAGYWRANCVGGKWSVRADPNGEFCAACQPFPREGEACSLEDACQSGPPPICLTRTCYAAPVVATCSAGKWSISGRCDK